MTDIAELGFRVDSSQLGRATQDLDRLGDQAQVTGQQVQRGTRTASRGMTQMGTSASALSRTLGSNNTRMFAMQLSQVAQQAAAGGGVLRALSIQMADIGMIFGTVGIAVGVAAGALLPLAGNLLSVGGNAKRAEDALDDFTDAAGRVVSEAETARKSVGDLREEYGRFAEEIQRGARIAGNAALSGALLSFEDARGAVGPQVDDFEQTQRRFAEALEALGMAQDTLGERTARNAASFEQFEASVAATRAEMQAAAEALGLTVLQADAVNQALDDLVNAEGMGGIAEAAGRVLAEFDAILASGQALTPEMQAVVEEARRIQVAAAAAATASEGIRVDVGNIGAAADEAERLAFNMANAAGYFSEAVAARAVESGIADGSIPPWAREDLPQSDADQALERIRDRQRREFRLSQRNSGGSRSGGGGGGGGGAAGPAFDPLGNIRDQITEQERLREQVGMTEAQVASYRAEMEALDAAKQNGITLTDSLRAAISAEAGELEKVTQATIDARAQQEMMVDLQRDLASAFADWALGMGSAEDALRSLARQLLEFGAQAALAGLFPNQFQMPTFGGMRASGGPVTAGRAYVVGERGREYFVPDQSGRVVNSSQVEGGGGNVEINIVNTYASADVQARRGPKGRIDIEVREAVGNVIASGGADKAMRSRFGVTPASRGG